MSLIALVSKLSTLKLDNLDLSTLVVSFDKDKFDISTLLSSLNLSESDISAILDMFNNSDVDLDAVFKNCDYSCLGAIVIDLSGLIDSLCIDLSDWGIDVSDYDLSAISLSDIIDILNKTEFNMSTISAVFKLFGLELDDVDLSGLISSFDTDNFDISSLLNSLNLSDLDISAILDMFNNSDVDLDAVFKNCDYSCLDAIVLNLSGLIDSAGIDLSELGIDVSDYDLSEIKLSDIIDILNNSDFDLSENTSELDLSTIELDKLDFSGLVVSFDKDKFDISTLLSSLNLSELDVSGILDMFNNSEVDLGSVFKNCDYSCLGAIVLDLSRLIDSLGIDLSDLGIDVLDYDLSAISLSDIIDILNKTEFNMSTITAVFKLFGLELDDVDLSGLISSFDTDNFDISALLNSLNLSGLDISGISDMFNKLDVDLEAVFKNCDYSCLGAIVLDLSGLIDSSAIDLSELGIDVSDYDLSAISLSDLIDLLIKSEFIMSLSTLISKLCTIELDNLETSDLIVSFDSENFDISGLITSLDLSTVDIPGILGMYDRNAFDLTDFLNKIIGLFMLKTLPEVTSTKDTN